VFFSTAACGALPWRAFFNGVGKNSNMERYARAMGEKITYAITVDDGEPIYLADVESREAAEAEARRYRHELYVGSAIRLYAVVWVEIENGTAVEG
jgi:hypothetical protein